MDTINNADSFSSSNPPKPTPEVAKRIEELLTEQLYELGVNVKALTPEEISTHMKCHVAPDNGLTYFWKNRGILEVFPEVKEDSVVWRMFTPDDDIDKNIAQEFLED